MFTKERLLASGGDRSNLGDEVEAGLADESEMRSLGADDPARAEFRFPGTGYASGAETWSPRADDPDDNVLELGNPVAGILRNQK